MKRLIALLAMLAALVVLSSCNWTGNNVGTLTLSAPESGYPPMTVTLAAIGVDGGQYHWEVDGRSWDQGSNTLLVTIEFLPCEVTVTWTGDGIPQTATETIWLENTGPVIGQPLIRRTIGMTIDPESKSIIVPTTKYLVTFPGAYDNEGGPATLINLTVFTPHWDGGRYNTTFCPPYEGINPPEPAEWRVVIGYAREIDNAAYFFSMWDSPLLEDYNLPWCPMSWWMAGYLGSNCHEYWPDSAVPQGTTVITATFEDEMGARTTESFTYPTTAYIPCDERQPVQKALCL